ncbi:MULTISPECIES: DUF3558 domain-containing protein [unclassified Saccharothrix]|uniref:DUF3558 domain-containing protein n=1 Tax=unclassified Saccharothrix TaxID=2593673 RepID=UPI00307EBFF7
MAVVGAAAFTLVGCTTGQAGNPTPETGSTGASKTTTATSAASDRPKAVKLDGLDPCKALTADDQKQLGTAAVNAEPSELIPGVASKACSYVTAAGVTPRYTYTVDLVTGKGYDHWKGGGNQDVAPTEVSGFPAKQVTFKGTTNFECSVAVDVADGQHLFVQFRPVGRDTAQDQLCRNANKGAELALATLQTLK